MGVALHRGAYRRGWLKIKRLNRPVVSIGNLTVGGTGKTPLVAYVAEMLSRRGLKPAILTRGYKRQSRENLIVVEPARERSPDPREIGDEPALLARKLPQIPIVVGAGRFRAGCAAESRFNVDVHILDDGFQHWGLARDVDIVVWDVTQDFSDAALLPAGSLREPLTALARAHIVVLSRAELENSTRAEKTVREINPQAKIFQSATQLRHIQDIASGSTLNVEEWLGEAVLAFCGIGNPDAFFADVRRWGMNPVQEVAFGDHHVYTANEIKWLAEQALRIGATALLTTEKDAMNFPADWKSEYPVQACVIQSALPRAAEFEEAVVQHLQGARVSV
jgi:tetraacyldisaccharide 4'-kinase